MVTKKDLLVAHGELEADNKRLRSELIASTKREESLADKAQDTQRYKTACEVATEQVGGAIQKLSDAHHENSVRADQILDLQRDVSRLEEVLVETIDQRDDYADKLNVIQSTVSH